MTTPEFEPVIVWMDDGRHLVIDVQRHFDPEDSGVKLYCFFEYRGERHLVADIEMSPEQTEAVARGLLAARDHLRGAP